MQRGLLSEAIAVRPLGLSEPHVFLLNVQKLDADGGRGAKHTTDPPPTNQHNGTKNHQPTEQMVRGTTKTNR